MNPCQIENIRFLAFDVFGTVLDWRRGLREALSAAIVGALHALGPGHGKSLMAAVLVGEKATLSRALALGTVMTLTHVADVFAMALLGSFISGFLPPIDFLHWLEIGSAAALAIFGLFNSIQATMRYRQVRGNPEAALADDAHARAHELGLAHTHGPAEHRDPFTKALWLGFVGSLAPCPAAWAMFLATVSLGRIGAGILLLVAFTVGLHVTILAIGFLLVLSKSFALRRTSPKLTYVLPIISACITLALGIVLLYQNLA